MPVVTEDIGSTLNFLRHFFETHCVHAGILQRVVDAWLGHGGDRSVAAVYCHLSDEQSQAFTDCPNFSLYPLRLGAPAN